MKNPNEELMLKNVEFYAQSVAAWYNTKIELSKCLLLLSSGGLVLLLNLIKGGKYLEYWFLGLSIFTAIAFIICIISVLLIFDKNASHIKEVLNNEISNDLKLLFLDHIASYSFYTGMIMVTIIGFIVSKH